MIENWKPIFDYPNYFISDLGRVKNSDSNLILKPYLDRNRGYYIVSLSKNSQVKKFQIHRLVGIHFLPNFENKKEIDHIDNDKTNNKVYNLRWATRIENGRNRKKQNGTSSVYKGVYWNKQKNKWHCVICINYRKNHLGLFANELDAAKKYNEFIITNNLEKYFKLNDL